MRSLLFFIALLTVSSAASAQNGLPLQTLSLESLSAFDKPAENWMLAGSVYSDLALHHSLSTTPGNGILVNQPTECARENLFTKWTHGDIELELEFMMPPGSNSGIYLQGRYEVQLLDSWKRPHVTFGDVGGIYQRWNEDEGRGFEGRPPRINASRAPGLWQSLRIVFDAPDFDENGNKIRPARFVQVVLNGSIIQENVTISGPTRAAGFQDESPVGPLMIQGDHGPVAFRNIQYRMSGDAPVSVSNVTYFEYTDDPSEEVIWNSTGQATATGNIRDLQEHVVISADPIALRYEGTIHIPVSGTYRFDATLDWISGDPHWSSHSIGGALLRIADQEVLKHDRNQPSVYGDVSLNEGAYPFSFGYFKAIGWGPPQVSLSVEGPSTRTSPLLQPLQGAPAAERIPITVGNEPMPLRGFIVHRGIKHTHSMAVGNPNGTHYTLDLSTASLLHAWRGPFVDAAPMWHNRGHDQTILPLGSLLTFSGHSAINTTEDTKLQFTGYRLAPYPVFIYSLGDAVLEDHIQSQYEASGLSRRLILTGDTNEQIWVHIAVSDQIDLIGDRLYAIDGFTWYVLTNSDALIQPSQNGQVLMIPLQQDQPGAPASANYVIVW
ncbi:MAG: DUF1080 domain-containing protein [Rhodothermaceae bacterium]|nr:DUF1080 domain-containing protein [Rhodothermaceae bacterium]MYE62587.1 DUF1080 domain-containing protein [Rhodothermaceae bacterium]MYJ21335.1 DUF1080 domain-containing protein [Rhodothermaceae bacterium]